MNIFISWSGDRSHQVAKLLKHWIKGVIQASKPWISSDDIGSGTKWFAEITGQLETTAQGIICVTNANKSSPWVLFEAGALSKGLTTSPRVYPLLIDLDTQDVTGPLAQFNHTWANRKPSMFKLMLDINASLPLESQMEPSVLTHVFETFWPEFESKLAQIITNTQAGNPEKEERDEDSILVEILNTMRGLSKRVSGIEELMPSKISTDSPIVIPKGPSAVARAPLSYIIRTRVERGWSDDRIMLLAEEKYPDYPKDFIADKINQVRNNIAKGES